MTNVFLRASGASLTAQADNKITSGMIGVPVNIEYDSAWDGLTKTVIFRVGSFARVRKNVGTTTTVPWEVLRIPGGVLSVGIEGRNEDGNVVIPTIWATVSRILPGANGEISAAPNPDSEESGGVGGAVIDDSQTSLSTTWSSKKISEEIELISGGNVDITTIAVVDPLLDFPQLDYSNFMTLIADGILPVLHIKVATDPRYSSNSICYLKNWSIGYMGSPLIFESASYRVTVNSYETTCERTETDSGSVELDTTLSVEGKAADAKAVGDALKSTVKSINGTYYPDVTGNVEIEIGSGGVTDEQIEQAVADYLSENPVAAGDFSNFGCVFNSFERCNFDTNAKTVNIPQYSRIVYANSVITTTGTTALGGVTVDLSAVQHGYVVFNKSTQTYTAQAYTDTTFSADEIALFVYSDYGAHSVAGISDVSVNGVTKLLNNSVTTDKIADRSVTASKIVPGAIDSTATTVAGRIGLFFHANEYCNFDTQNKKLTIPIYGRVMSGKTVYVQGVLNTSQTLDLSSAQHGYITYSKVNEEWKVYPYSKFSLDSENELIMFVYSNYGKIVSSQSAYTVDGKMFGIDTDLNIPAGYVTRDMLAPKVLQNQLSRCPSYTFTDMSALNIHGWSDICIIGENLWMFFPSTGEEHTAADGTLRIVNKETMETVKTITHNFGHVNTCDYCKETDCLIVGNMPGNTAYPAALYIFYNVSDWIEVDSLDFATIDKTIVDMRGAFPTATAAACSWGESNFAYNNIAYVSFGYDKQFTKIVLGMGTNQLTNGTYTAADVDKFNGTYNVLLTSDFNPMSSFDEVIQGATFYKGQMLTANGDEWTARASLWQFDINGNIQRELLEFPIYNADGQKNSQYKTYTEGITVDEETGYIYQGIFSGQLSAIRFYLIKYKL